MVRAGVAALALVAGAAACAPPAGAPGAPPAASSSLDAVVSDLATAVASRDAEVENPPPLPSLSPDRTTLTESEARALVLNLVPKVTGTTAGEWGGHADAPLEDAQGDVCGEPVPLPFDPAQGTDSLSDGSPDVLDFWSRGLVKPRAAGDEDAASVSLTALVFVDAERAAKALRRVRDAVARAGGCTEGDVDRLPPLEVVRTTRTGGSVAYTQRLHGESYASTTLAVRTGPVLLLVEGTAGRPQDATRHVTGLWDYALARLRATRLL